jgi:hypothetical protein
MKHILGPKAILVMETLHKSVTTEGVLEYCELIIEVTYAWLFMFYMFFHSYLTMWAELTGFADKRFYEDWWNSDNLTTYW